MDDPGFLLLNSIGNIEAALVVVLERVQFWPVRIESGYQLKIRDGYETGTGNTTLIHSMNHYALHGFSIIHIKPQ